MNKKTRINMKKRKFIKFKFSFEDMCFNEDDRVQEENDFRHFVKDNESTVRFFNNKTLLYEFTGDTDVSSYFDSLPLVDEVFDDEYHVM